MENPYRRTNAYIKEIKQKNNVNTRAKPIIDKFLIDQRLNLQTPIETSIKLIENSLTSQDNENKVREILRNELVKVLYNSQEISYFIEALDKSNDIYNFYKFGNAFLRNLKNVRGLDANYLLQLWNKYKETILNNEKYYDLQNKIENTKTKLNRNVSYIDIGDNNNEGTIPILEENKKSNKIIDITDAPFGYKKDGTPKKSNQGRKSKNPSFIKVNNKLKKNK